MLKPRQLNSFYQAFLLKIKKQLESPSAAWQILTFFPAALFFCFLTLKRFLYRFNFLNRFQPDSVSICIGNLTLGGNGKTPFLMHLVKHLDDESIQVVSKGYKRAFHHDVIVTPQIDVTICGDEPLLIAQSLPNAIVNVISDRKSFLKKHRHEAFIFDDGLHELGIEYTFKAALFDKSFFLRPAYLFPMGMLRDCLHSLKYVDLIAIKGALSEQEYQTYSSHLAQYSKVPICTFELVPKDIFAFKEGLFNKALPTAAFCGIGFPESFFEQLKKMGIHLVDEKPLLDHVAMREEELVEWMNKCKEKGILQIICTRKDAVKIQKTLDWPLHLFVLDVECVIKHGQNHFDEFIKKVKIKLFNER